MAELWLEFNPSAYLTDTQLSRLKRIPRSFTGAMIVVNDSGIYISNGKGAMITMIGPTIDFNTGALTILK